MGTISMYEPFREKIIEWCIQGDTIPQMIEKLGGHYTRQSLYTFIKKNNLRYGYGNVYMHRNHCVGCEFCREFKNPMGKYNKENKICTLSWRVIAASVVCSPRWCEKGELYGKHLRKL